MFRPLFLKLRNMNFGNVLIYEGNNAPKSEGKVQKQNQHLLPKKIMNRIL